MLRHINICAAVAGAIECFYFFASFVWGRAIEWTSRVVYTFLEYDIMIVNVCSLKFSQLAFFVAVVVVADVVVVIITNNSDDYNNNSDLRLFLVNFAHSKRYFHFLFLR